MATQGLEGLASGSAPRGFSIESLADRYFLHVVPYEDGVSTLCISKELLDNGKTHKQQEWSALTGKYSWSWKVPSGPLYHAACSALYANREHPAEKQRTLVTEVKNMLADDARKYVMMTSTRIFYSSEGEDIVVHNFGYDNERRIKGVFVGSNGFVKKGRGFDNAIEALFGTKDCENVEAVYSWLSGKAPYLLRSNKRPQQDSERWRSLVLRDYCEGFGIFADVELFRKEPARGMVVLDTENSPCLNKV